MTRIFCDANVLFSAAITPEGRSAAIFDLAREHELVASPHVVEEARRNVAARYPDTAARLEDLLGRVAAVGEAPGEVVEWAAGQGLPEQDAPVLAAAVHADVDALVTGDRRHFGRLMGRALRGVHVMSIRDLLAELLEG